MSFTGLVILFVAIILSTVLHELAHGYVAYWLGDETAKESGRLSLNPLVHIDPYMSILIPVILYILGGPIFGGAKPVPVNTRNLKGGAWGMALVAIAGPLTNFILAFVIFAIAVWTNQINIVNGGIKYGEWGGIWLSVVFMELGFALFNMIPVPPLDGSRVLYAILPDSLRIVMEGIERYGILLVFVLVMFLSGTLSSVISTAMMGIVQWFCLIFS